MRTEENKNSLCYGGKSPKLYCNHPVLSVGGGTLIEEVGYTENTKISEVRIFVGSDARQIEVLWYLVVLWGQ